MRPFKIAIIGLGKIAKAQHLPAIAANDRFDLAATVCPLGGSCGVPAFRDMEAMIEAELGIDAVVICTPPLVRVDLARRALEAGMHVLLEKPPGLTPEQLCGIREIAAGARLGLMTAWHSRESRVIDEARKWLEGRKVESGFVTWRENIRKWHPGQDWLLEEGGFGVFDSAINAFSVLTALLPHELTVVESVLSIPANRKAAVEADVSLLAGNTATIRCDLSIIEEGGEQWDIEISTNNGTLALINGGHQLIIDGEPVCCEGDREYLRIYHRMAALMDAGQSEVDVRPLAIATDAIARGALVPSPAFHF